MICSKCRNTPAPDCRSTCESPITCPCQHREVVRTELADGSALVSPVRNPANGLGG